MLPESQFPVTGGIMQSEDIVAGTQSMLLDDHSPAPECRIAALEEQPVKLTNHLHLNQPQDAPPPYPVQVPSMAVKQEPAEEEDKARGQPNAGLNSPQMEIEDGQSLADGNLDPSMAPACKRPPPGGEHISPKFELPGAQVSPNSVLPCKKQPSRGRRKSRWKLKFHHQALPPEYLDHYEAALAQEAAQLSSPVEAQPPFGRHPQQRQLPPTPTGFSPDVQNWIQRFTFMQQQQAELSSAASRRSVIRSTHSSFPTYNSPQPPQSPLNNEQTSARPPMQYSDLPYMGEITLDNSKPRRGRKPKKADICHLIYKNYGTILPGTPAGLQEAKPPVAPAPVLHSHDAHQQQLGFQRSDIQNRISSLLERRLTQERRALEASAREQDGPLNLCVRDLRLTGSSEGSSDAEDAEPVQQRCGNGCSNRSAVHEESNGTDVPGPLSYWPDQLLCLQRLVQAEQQQQRLVPKPLSSLLEATVAPPSSPTASSSTGSSSNNSISAEPTRRGSPTTTSEPRHHQVQSKRKRSAIFIPPVPAENSSGANTPATEVSICKFKFTGGARPSLQEKKSLSVDAGGNFRYYSGTGDKSMRGYEFFPREALQQQRPPVTSVTSPASLATGQQQLEDARGRKTRKTRKSIQREKLEQTFKEKGFLIQTQQHESVEGATFCKFRQLRKFTRYLYRHWKERLPDDVAEFNGATASASLGQAQLVNELADDGKGAPVELQQQYHQENQMNMDLEPGLMTDS
ncbi:uncharacterized protein LOC106645328 [Copidosoma floridanum]|uniref:uncharacterized protein LOC106645328 n=1 Tax=Copidosoma floridanum TaxID=29053 RepID=UPI0006C98388|nr:uncharacterized protein LOC106645328 [Copidosoma floridanum]